MGGDGHRTVLQNRTGAWVIGMSRKSEAFPGETWQPAMKPGLAARTLFCLFQFCKIYVLAAFCLAKELLLRIRSGKWPAPLWRLVDMANGQRRKRFVDYYEDNPLYSKACVNGVSQTFDGMSKLLMHGNPAADLHQRSKGIAVVIGGAGGIGFEVVQELLSCGMHVIVGVQNELEENTITKKRNCHTCKMEVWHVDLSSMKSVKSFANKFLALNTPLHLLINCAGIMCAPYMVTEDGFESHFAINYLSHCLLIRLLLPCLKRAGSEQCYTRIVTMASSVHSAGHIYFGDLQSRHCYSSYHAYMQSKLALVMFTYSLQRYLDSDNSYVTVNCLHPGVTNTGLFKHIWWAPFVASYFFKTPKEGAEAVLHAALSPELEGNGGHYLEECAISKSSKYSYDLALQISLWNETWRLLKTWCDTASPL